MLAAAYTALSATKAVLDFTVAAGPVPWPRLNSSVHALHLRRLQIEAASLMVPVIIVCVASVLRGISLVWGLGEQHP